MKKIELLNLQNSLMSLQGYEGVKFNLAIAYNVETLDTHTKVLRKEAERVGKMRELYDQERIELAKKYADKDGQGKAKLIVDPNNGTSEYDIPAADRKAFDDGIDELKKKHKKTLDAFDKAQAEYEKVITEEEVDETKIKFTLIGEDIIPRNIKTQDLVAIRRLIKKSGKDK